MLFFLEIGEDEQLEKKANRVLKSLIMERWVQNLSASSKVGRSFVLAEAYLGRWVGSGQCNGALTTVSVMNWT